MQTSMDDSTRDTNQDWEESGAGSFNLESESTSILAFCIPARDRVAARSVVLHAATVSILR